ncbi:MAG: Hpt domain-containing protein [Treponema sp.]|nr:MAG: Hpt domain-containing protein [Treponema sp.]
MSSINVTAAIDRFGGDSDIYLEMVQTFIETADTDFARLKPQLNLGQYQQVALTVHRMKGALATLGADEFVKEAGELEKALKQVHSAPGNAPAGNAPAGNAPADINPAADKKSLTDQLQKAGALYAKALVELKAIAAEGRTQT